MAIVQYASQPVIDLGVQGMLDGLAEAGFIDGKSVRRPALQRGKRRRHRQRHRPRGDERAIRLVLTATTPLPPGGGQREPDGEDAAHFGLVSDPFIGGVGIRRDNPWITHRTCPGSGRCSRWRRASGWRSGSTRV